jgi:excinuclease ABC subunit B
MFDLEMLRTDRRLQRHRELLAFPDGRAAGRAAADLLDYFPKDWLLIVDESHVSAIPQVGGMYRGDRARKETLVDYGFRLPRARQPPAEVRGVRGAGEPGRLRVGDAGEYEIKAGGTSSSRSCAPTGLLDPLIEVRPARNQVDDLLARCARRVEKGLRVLVTTLTKRMAEELTDYYARPRRRVRYLHATSTPLERTAILRDLRLGEFDVLVGINLLREGLDLPEVALVAILDADKEGFLRNDDLAHPDHRPRGAQRRGARDPVRRQARRRGFRPAAPWHPG